MPSVNDPAVRDKDAHRGGIGSAELVPFRQECDNVGSREGGVHRVDVVQVRVQTMRVGVSYGVVHRDGGAFHKQHACDVKCRCVADVVRVRLERGAKRCNFNAFEVPADHLADQVHCTNSTTVVDRVHRAEEADSLADAELLRAVLEGSNVLRETAPAETEARLEKTAADAVVEAQGVREDTDVCPSRLAHFGHRVDEGDFRSEEGVRRDLHEFGGREVGDDDRCSRAQDRFEHLTQLCFSPARVDPEYQAVGVERVLDCKTFAKELRVPSEFELGTDR